MTDIEEFFKRIRNNYPFFAPFFDDLFKDLDLGEDGFEEFEREMAKDFTNKRKEHKSSHTKKSEPFIYGYSVNIDENGKAEIREFGNIKPNLKGSPMRISESREPLIDIMEGEKVTRVVIELPGVNKSDIKVDVKDFSIIISTTNAKNYYKEISLINKIIPKSAKAKYNNGLLEVIVNKDDNNESTNNTLRIE